IDTTNARVISMAMPALEKSGVSRRTVVMLGGIAGGGLGAIAALGLALFGGSLPAPPAGLRRWPFRNRHEPVAAQASPPPAPADPVPVVAAATEPPSPDAVAAPARTGWRRFMAIQGGQPARTPEVVRAPAA
ncbi:hypothetical protein AB4156_44130, partial [Cupriavidus sp. 2MCAB6]